MKAPDKIYYGVLDNGFQCVNTVQTSTTPDAYIRKDALLEWAKNWEKIGVSDDFAYAIETLIKHIESL